MKSEVTEEAMRPVSRMNWKISTREVLVRRVYELERQVRILQKYLERN